LKRVHDGAPWNQAYEEEASLHAASIQARTVQVARSTTIAVTRKPQVPLNLRIDVVDDGGRPFGAPVRIGPQSRSRDS